MALVKARRSVWLVLLVLAGWNVLAGGAGADALLESPPPFRSYYADRMDTILREANYYEIAKVRDFPIYYVDFTTNELRSRALERIMIFVESDVDHGKIIPPVRLFEVMSEYGAAAGYDLDIVNLARFFTQARNRGADLDPMETRFRGSLLVLGLLADRGGRFVATGPAAVLSITSGLDEQNGAGTTAWIRDHEFRHGFYYTELRPGVHAIWEGYLSDREQAIVGQTLRITAPYDPTNESLMEREFYSMIFEKRFEDNLRKLPTTAANGDARPTPAEVKRLAAKLPDVRDQFIALEALLLGVARR